MATEAQVSANRANAQKSTGPRTAEGKAAVAQNALTHGLMARAAVLQGEEWEEYTSFHEGMIQELYPDGVQEEELAERYQNAVFETLYDQYAAEQVQTPAPADPVPSVASDPVLGRMLVADFSGDRVLERALLYERRIESSLHRACADLRQLRRQPVTSARAGGSSLDRRWADAEEKGWGRRGQGEVSSVKCQVSRQLPVGIAAARGIGVPPMPHGRDAHATMASAQPVSAGGRPWTRRSRRSSRSENGTPRRPRPSAGTADRSHRTGISDSLVLPERGLLHVRASRRAPIWAAAGGHAGYGRSLS